MKIFTHQNGGRPFMVIINKNNKHIEVYKISKDYKSYDKKVFNTHYQKLFLGSDPKNYSYVIGGPNYSKKKDGNSILLKISDYVYVFIGTIIYTFKTQEDEILKYFSLVGNNDVPYPYAVSKTKTYLMLNFVVINNHNIDMNRNPIGQYYKYHSLKIALLNEKNNKEKEKIKKEIIIAKQLVDSCKNFRKKILVKEVL
jgi:hypothetical protein